MVKSETSSVSRSVQQKSTSLSGLDSSNNRNMNMDIGIREIPEGAILVTYAKLIDPLNSNTLAEECNLELVHYRLWSEVDSCRFPKANIKLHPNEKLVIDESSENIWAIKTKELIRLGVKITC